MALGLLGHPPNAQEQVLLVFTGLVVAGATVLVVVLTAAAARGLIPANGLVGIRTPALLRSEQGWQAGHRAALRVLVPAGAVLVVAGVAVALVDLPWSLTRETSGLVLTIPLVVALCAAGVVADAAAKRA